MTQNSNEWRYSSSEDLKRVRHRLIPISLSSVVTRSASACLGPAYESGKSV